MVKWPFRAEKELQRIAESNKKANTSWFEIEKLFATEPIGCFEQDVVQRSANQKKKKKKIVGLKEFR